ncbi:MAG: Wadjet anti-phage system protein JetD domain-containing protein, partial [Gammaproteobacteria bacterium]
PPSTAERAHDQISCHKWAAVWAGYGGPGTVEHAMLQFPTGRTHRMPKRLILRRPGEVAAGHPDDQRIWRRCGQRLTRLQEAFPDACYERVVRRITDLSELDFERLHTTAAWLRRHPTSGMLLRQLPIEGIDTKWLAGHATLVLALLGKGIGTDTDDSAGDTGETDDTAATEDGGESRRRALHARLGLRIPPDLVQVSVCDARLRAQVGGMRHFAASVEDLNRWETNPEAVAILENKETGYAVTDDLRGAVILHGHGRYVEQYARIDWVRGAERVVYWGDLDVPGLQFVSDLRALGVPARTILTDRTTLERYRHLAVDRPAPRCAVAPAHLTTAELELYQLLVDHARVHDTGLLLEQERLPWPDAALQLRAALAGSHQIP